MTLRPLHIESQHDLRSIVAGPALHRASLYVPFDRAPTELHASRLRLRGCIDRVSERLRERGVADEEVRARLERLEAVQPELRSQDGWMHTLAWLGDREGWALARLAEPLEERVVVARHYALRPLIRALDRDRRFRVLAVSPKRVSAWEGDASGLWPAELEGVPGSLEEALGSETRGRPELSFRSDQPVPGRRANAPIYHGHGGADEERSLDRERFLRVLGPAVSTYWRRSELPVVLAAELRTASELRKYLELPSLLDDEVRGAPDHWSAQDLHARVLPVVRAHLEDREQRLARQYDRARSAGKGIERELDAAARAAVGGRIRRLWVEETARIPGRCIDEAEARCVPARDPQEDALDALVGLVLARAGEVRVVGAGGTPGEGAFCAELR